MEMLHWAVRRTIIEDMPNPGDTAGEHYVTLCSTRGLAMGSEHSNYYAAGMHHAAIADLVVTAIHKHQPWQRLDKRGIWEPSALVVGDQLRRFIAVSHWSEEREAFERHSWYVLGEIAHYEMPMQMVVAVLGPMRGGRRSGYFSKGLLHPSQKNLRFRRKKGKTIGDFKETWLPIFREEHAEISRETWLQAMMDDDVLQEVLFVVRVPVPEPETCRTIRELAKVQLEKLQAITTLPPKQLATCWDPIAPCPFRVCCHGTPETEPGPLLQTFRKRLS